MKVSVYLKRKKSAVDADLGISNICFRVRDKDVDIKAVSELEVAESLWDPDTLGYKSSAKVTKTKRESLRKAVTGIVERLMSTFSGKANGEWAKRCIEDVLHPVNAFARDHATLISHMSDYISKMQVKETSKQHVATLMRKLQRYERYRRECDGESDFCLFVETISVDDINDFRDYIANEYSIYQEHPELFEYIEQNYRPKRPLSQTSIINDTNTLVTFLKWCRREGLTDNDSYELIGTRLPVYGDPFFLTIEERNRLYDADLSECPRLALVRDIFVFHCLVGCRVGDLMRLTRDNIIDGFIEYVPEKTKRNQAKTVRVPLHQKASAILDRYIGVECDGLFPFPKRDIYNKRIRELLKLVGIDRVVTVLDTTTGKPEQRHLYEVVSSHTARKTFIGNLYKKLPDPNLIASMSGHVEGSRAFRRYRNIDDEMKKELVDLIK